MIAIENQHRFSFRDLWELEEDEQGWRELPNGKRVNIGRDVKLGYGIVFGDNLQVGASSRIFNGVVFGDNIQLGKNVKIGHGAVVGDSSFLGNNARIGDGAKLGKNVVINSNVSLGYAVKLTDGTTSTKLNLDGIAAYKRAGDSHIFVKWVCEGSQVHELQWKSHL